jgi:hypothetical protein
MVGERQNNPDEGNGESGSEGQRVQTDISAKENGFFLQPRINFQGTIWAERAHPRYTNESENLDGGGDETYDAKHPGSNRGSDSANNCKKYMSIAKGTKRTRLT